MTLNGYAYQRFDFRAIADRLEGEKDEDGTVAAPTDEEIEAAERNATLQAEQQKQQGEEVAQQEFEDMERMVADLSEEDRAAFRAFEATQPTDVDPLANNAWEQRSLAHRVTMPKSTNPTCEVHKDPPSCL